jgi:hypothetical protein
MFKGIACTLTGLLFSYSALAAETKAVGIKLEEHLGGDWTVVGEEGQTPRGLEANLTLRHPDIKNFMKSPIFVLDGEIYIDGLTPEFTRVIGTLTLSHKYNQIMTYEMKFCVATNCYDIVGKKHILSPTSVKAVITQSSSKMEVGNANLEFDITADFLNMLRSIEVDLDLFPW